MASDRHGECAYNFKDGEWYGITIEFIQDHAIAHLNHEYIAYAQHPMIDKERTYFAFPVDQAGASRTTFRFSMLDSILNRQIIFL